MGWLEKKFLTGIYQRAKRPEDLPWHRGGKAPEVLVQTVMARGAGGRALDLGCGQGEHAVWLAEQGYQVTGLDFVPEALAMARAHADAAGVDIELVETDVLSYSPSRSFDLVLDSGCLHCLPRRKDLATYHKLLFNWLAPDADYVLVHFGQRYRFDWRPIGPRRRTPEQIRAFLGDRLVERAHTSELVPSGTALVLEGIVRLDCYWFSRCA